MAEKVTIQDIARLAGVSKATVSRVLNKKPDVDPATRERIMRIVREQEFVPSITASGLAGGRNRLIGVLLPALTWPLIPELMRGVADITEDAAYELVLYSISTVNHERNRSSVIDRILASKLTSALLAVFPGQSAEHLVELHQHGYPIVLVDDQHPPTGGIPWVCADNRKGGYEATRHLIRLGHKRIAHIQGPKKYKVSHDRYQGYCDALQEAGLPLDPTLVLEGDFMQTGGRACAEILLGRSPEQRPTAIFAASDFMAYGVMSAAETYGLRIPEDIALVGFDDNPPSAHLQPALTTVRQPFYEMGQCAIQLLLQYMEASRTPQWKRNEFENAETPGALVESSMPKQLATTLVVRVSCGASQTQSSFA